MSLIDEARAIARANQRGPQCRIAQLLEAHPEVEDELEEALAEPILTGTAIAAALKSRYGNDAPSAQTVNRHRKGERNCGPQRRNGRRADSSRTPHNQRAPPPTPRDPA